MTKTTVDKQVQELTNRVLILEKMVAHILYTEPRDDDNEEEFANPYPPEPVTKSIYEKLDPDPLLDKAWEALSEANKVSTSIIQRKLNIGYYRATVIIDQLEKREIVSMPLEYVSRNLLKPYNK